MIKYFYVAGPMRGYPHFNFPAFEDATKDLRSHGHVVFSPAERDLEKYPNIADNRTGDEGVASAHDGFSLRDALKDDMCWICDHATDIYMLRGWEKSQGATCEWQLARALGLKVHYQ